MSVITNRFTVHRNVTKLYFSNLTERQIPILLSLNRVASGYFVLSPGNTTVCLCGQKYKETFGERFKNLKVHILQVLINEIVERKRIVDGNELITINTRPRIVNQLIEEYIEKRVILYNHVPRSFDPRDFILHLCDCPVAIITLDTDYPVIQNEAVEMGLF